MRRWKPWNERTCASEPYRGHLAPTATTLERDYGVRAGQVTVAYPGVDAAPVAAGSGSNDVVLLAVGAVIPRKDHRALIEALGGLRDLHWRLRVVGNLDRFPRRWRPSAPGPQPWASPIAWRSQAS